MIVFNGAPLPTPGNAGASEAAGRPDSSAELLTLWKSVFQNSRAVSADTRQFAPDSHQQQAAPSNPLTADGGQTRGGAPTPGGSFGNAPQTAERFAPSEVQAAPALRAPAVSAAIASGPASARTAATDSGEMTVARMASAESAAEDMRPSIQAAAEETEASGEAVSSQPLPQATSAESVSVFSHGTGIAIVVRDGSLSHEEALRSAFETAQQLMGRRSALGLLTLNGQVLYQQASSANHAPPSNPLWKMVC